MVEVDAQYQIHGMQQIAKSPHIICQRAVAITAFRLRARDRRVNGDGVVIGEKSDEVQNMTDGLAWLVTCKYNIGNHNRAGIDERIPRQAVLMLKLNN